MSISTLFKGIFLVYATYTNTPSAYTKPPFFILFAHFEIVV